MTSASETPSAVEFCLVAESGILEQQALVLCESIRRFAGKYADSRVTVISPRATRRPSPRTIQRLHQLNANYVALDLVSPTPEYGPSHKTLALGWCARQGGPDVLVQIDSDTIFLGEPDLGLNGHGAAARPVDVKGICSYGPGDSLEAVWQRMCAVCGVDIEAIGYVRSSVGNHLLRASFNGGLVAAHRDVFELAEQCFLHIAAADIRPNAGETGTMASGSGLVSTPGLQMWGTTQAAFSLAMAKLGRTVRILDPGANVPLHMIDELDQLPARIVHLHYHWLFADDPDKNPALDGRLPLNPEQTAWLRARLPLGSDSALHEPAL